LTASIPVKIIDKVAWISADFDDGVLLNDFIRSRAVINAIPILSDVLVFTARRSYTVATRSKQWPGAALNTFIGPRHKNIARSTSFALIRTSSETSRTGGITFDAFYAIKGIT